jgi:hypothetical protein
MSSTRSFAMKRAAILGLLAVAGIGLSSCAFSQTHLSDDFGAAVRQDVVAQIADPNAHYPGPPPPSNGARAALAQTRYRTGTTIPPVATASTIGVSSEGSPGGAPPAAAPAPAGP